MFRPSRQMTILGGLALAVLFALWLVPSTSAGRFRPGIGTSQGRPGLPTRPITYPPLRPGFDSMNFSDLSFWESPNERYSTAMPVVGETAMLYCVPSRAVD